MQLSRDPLVAVMFFRIETKASEVWDGVDTTGPRTAKAASPKRPALPSATALTVAERTAKNTRSVFAAQFLRAFHLSTRGSCAPWPANAYPLLQLVTETVIDRIQSDGNTNFLGQCVELSCQCAHRSACSELCPAHTFRMSLGVFAAGFALYSGGFTQAVGPRGAGRHASLSSAPSGDGRHTAAQPANQAGAPGAGTVEFG